MTSDDRASDRRFVGGRGMEIIFAFIFIIAFYALFFNAFIVLLEIIVPIWLVYKLIQLTIRGIKALIDTSKNGGS